jgi:hypothetical protein
LWLADLLKAATVSDRAAQKCVVLSWRLVPGGGLVYVGSDLNTMKVNEGCVRVCVRVVVVGLSTSEVLIWKYGVCGIDTRLLISCMASLVLVAFKKTLPCMGHGMFVHSVSSCSHSFDIQYRSTSLPPPNCATRRVNAIWQPLLYTSHCLT